MPPRKQPRSRRSFASSSRGGVAGHDKRIGSTGLQTAFMPFSGAISTRPDSSLTLKEEALNTEEHQSSRDSTQNLRNIRVNFVAATAAAAAAAESQLEPGTAPGKTEDAMAEMTLNAPWPEDMEVPERDLETTEGELIATPPQTVGVAPLFIMDTIGGDRFDTGLRSPSVRSVSPTPSNSSEEVILFKGRNHVANATMYRTVDSINDPVDNRLLCVDAKLHEQEALLEEVLQQKHVPTSIRSEPSEALTRRTRRTHREGRIGEAEEAAMLADYIENMDPDDLQMMHSPSFNQRELGGAEDDVWQDEDLIIVEEEMAVQDEISLQEERSFGLGKKSRDGWSESDIQDLDDMSTSDEIMGEVEAVLARRERVGGSQYLIIWEQQTVGDARWVPVTTLEAAGASQHIQAFEADVALIPIFPDSDDSNDAQDDDAEDEADDLDLIQRRKDRMTDEKLANALQKQERLGMGSADLLLYDEAFADEEVDEGTLFTKVTRKKSSKSYGKGKIRARDELPAATTFTDAYDGFDIMDFDRPSLKKSPKGRKGKADFVVSDTELEESLQKAWNNDRMKKKSKKQEREELRFQGRLGKKDKPDMKAKYQEGMAIHKVKEEIKQFLMGSHTTLALPPMDKANRKIIHELGNAFKLKTKSIGDGNKRFPVLIKTSYTSSYVEHTYRAVEAKLSRRYLPRMDLAGRKGVASKSVGRGGGSNAAVGYRDGDIVGASAPELGADNKGRAMLEKMGWSQGTALGALNNKGIMQPVTHVVKTTKAGLG